MNHELLLPHIPEKIGNWQMFELFINLKGLLVSSCVAYKIRLIIFRAA
jgi:hypothetical protein